MLEKSRWSLRSFTFYHLFFFRNIRELDIQLSLDATEEGLLALAGRSSQKKDQGFHRQWDNALYIHKVMVNWSSLEFIVADSVF